MHPIFVWRGSMLSLKNPKKQELHFEVAIKSKIGHNAEKF